MKEYPKTVEITKNGMTMKKVQYRDLFELKNDVAFDEFNKGAEKKVSFKYYLEKINKLEFVPDILDEKERLRDQVVRYSILRSHLMDDDKSTMRLNNKYKNTYHTKDDGYMEEKQQEFSKRKVEEASTTIADLTSTIEIIEFVNDRTFKMEPEMER